MIRISDVRGEGGGGGEKFVTVCDKGVGGGQKEAKFAKRHF